MASPLVDPKNVNLITIWHPDLYVAPNAHRPLHTPNLPHIRVRPEAVEHPVEVVPLIQEHEVSPRSANGCPVNARADHAVVVAEETACGAGGGVIEEGWWALFSEGCEESGSVGCAGAHEGGKTIISNEALIAFRIFDLVKRGGM